MTDYGIPGNKYSLAANGEVSKGTTLRSSPHPDPLPEGEGTQVRRDVQTPGYSTTVSLAYTQGMR